MTFPTIPTVGAGRVLFANQADTSQTRTFPSLSSLTKSAGDLLIAIIVTYQSSTNPQFSSWGGGFTEFSDQGTSSTLGIGLAYKWSTGSETGTFSVTQATTVTGHASMCLLSIPLAHATTVPEAGTIANGTTGAADPGSFNPANWDAEDTLWIAVDGNGMTSGTGSWTACGAGTLTNFTNQADSNTTDNSAVGQTEVVVSFRQLNAASLDRGAVSTHDLSNARNSAIIIAVRPAAIAGSGSPDAQSADVDGAGTSSSASTDGAISAQAATVAGSGLSTSTGTGAPAAQAASASGSGLSASLGTGALAAGAADVTGEGEVSGDVNVTGTGALVAQAADVTASGLSASSGSGALSAQAADVTASGLSASTGTGSLAAGAASADGAGLSSSSGTGALEAQPAAVSGSDAAGGDSTSTMMTGVG